MSKQKNSKAGMRRAFRNGARDPRTDARPNRHPRGTPTLSPLSQAVLTGIASMAAGVPAHAQLEEVVVTATRRVQSMQDVPVSVTALSGNSLEQMRVTDFSDYVMMLPNVQVMGTGPGQNEIYIRGAATEQSILSISSTQGSSPAVALYQDEQPVSFGGRNLDIYATDLERIEVLPGPQGTLFGVSSQAGTVRLITAKPVLDRFEAGADFTHSGTRGGETSTALEGYLNVPLTDDLAVRIAGFSDRQGGWIDNVLNDPERGGYSPSIDVINRNDISNAPVNPGTPFVAADNSEFIEEDFNDASYAGGRFSLSYVRDEWDLLVQHTEQSLDSEGVFAFDPNLGGSSQVNRFAPDENHDDFGLTTWTLNARLGMLDFVYTGGFLSREVASLIDYTGYTNGGGYQVYYMCDGTRAFDEDLMAEDVPIDGACYDPSKIYQEETNSERITHEFRVSTPESNRLRGLGGVFVDSQETETVSAFELASTSLSDGQGGVIPNTGALQNVLGQVGNVVEGANAAGRQFNPLISFVNDFTRETDQIAAFGQVEFDFNDRLTGSLSARWYDLEFGFKGSTNSSFGCKFGPPGFYPADTNYLADGKCDGAAFDNDVTGRLRALGIGTQEAINEYFGASGPAVYDAIQNGNLRVDALDDDGVINETDTITRASIDWQLTDDIMVFGAYAEGFRPPVSNRNAARAANNPNELPVFADYRVPPYALTDKLDNFEIGLKGDFLDSTLRFNATAYFSEIEDLQTSRFDPSNVAFLVFIENVGDADVQGIDADWQWAPTADLNVSGALSWTDTEITRLNPQLEGIAVPLGSELPFTPEFSASVRARYGFDLGWFGGSRGYVTGSVSYTGDSKSGITGNAYFVEDTAERLFGRGTGLEIAAEGGDFIGGGGETFPNGRYVQQAYTIVNLAAGLERDQWRAEVFVDNVFDENAQQHIDTLEFTPRVVTNRPRTLGVRLSYDF